MAIDYDEPTGPARQSYDPGSQLGMYRAPSGRRQIPLINTAARGGDVHVDEPGMGLPALPVAPRPPSVGLPAIAGPAEAGNRFGSTNAFQDSLTRGRALRQVKAAGYVDNLAKGATEREAAQNAYVSSNLLAGNLALGGAPQQFGFDNDANARANAESGTKVGYVGSEAGVNRALSGQMIPAQANVQEATAGQINQQTDRAARMLPYEQKSAQIDIQHKAATTPYAGPGAAADVKQKEATAAAAAAGVGLTKQYQDQLKQAQARIAHLEGILSTRPHNPGQGELMMDPNAGAVSPRYGTQPSAPAQPAQPTPNAPAAAAIPPGPAGVPEGTPHPSAPNYKYRSSGPKGPGYYLG